jgi:hypothetical protein
MYRLSTHLAGMMLALMLGLGSVSHAAETIACTAAGESVAGEAPAGHRAGDADEVPGDAGKAYPHHHAGCHGHHLASPCAVPAAVARSPQPALPVSQSTAVLVGAPAPPALHPPQA